MSHKLVMILVGMAASAAGFGIGWWWGRERLCEDLLAVTSDEEEEIEDFFEDDTDEDPDYLGERAVRLQEARKELQEKAQYHKYVIPAEDMKDKTQPIIEDPKPVIIDVETYEDEMEQDGWDKVEYTYFAKRTENCPFGLLVDEYAGLRVNDPSYDIGNEAIDILRAVPEGEEANVYVRNPILGCDILVKVSWEELSDEDREMYEDVGDRNEEGGVKG